MLSTDPQRLRWCGIDLRRRGVRRVVVLLSYAAMLAAIEIVRERGGALWQPVLLMAAVSLLLPAASVFGRWGPVKRFVPLPAPVGERAMVEGIDRLTRGIYGEESFLAAREESREDLWSRYEEGKRISAAKEGARRSEGDEPDEREVGIRDRALRRTLSWMNYLLLVLVVVLARPGVAWGRTRLVAVLLEIAVLGRTLPQAMVLWEEPDPREGMAEMALVREDEA